ncbi:hepatocyte nuclear factor 3-beta-like [Danaus plexippus]|uniref:Forkhead transcription factor HCM1 n=1 Tax=Danaus plexippus plexippus TaxID=278856 RepID=A0A212FEL3_DANPL|nr:hepatocyte nuclear factor 3-beta-like [Danaus plexippus]OWR52189.1 Forkhead transcription factor HCM1 [Danaus plexippus plexippus]
MASKTVSDKAKWRRRKFPKTVDEDNDCASLAWLLNFRLDEFVNVKVPDDEPVEALREVIEDSPPAAKKPPYTYPELIERALREKGELTVSAIYQWISDRFPFYKANDERWKNSVRHNLSINPHFRKGARASQGAGHLWSLAANAIDLLPLRNQTYEKTDVQETQIIECPKVIVLDEAAIAAASIMPDQDLFTGGTMFLNPVSTEQVVRECGLITGL